MKRFEQTLSDASLGFMKKALLSEAVKIKREKKEVLFYRRIYPAISRRRETAYNQVLEALRQLYELCESYQEEISQ